MAGDDIDTAIRAGEMKDARHAADKYQLPRGIIRESSLFRCGERAD